MDWKEILYKLSRLFLIGIFATIITYMIVIKAGFMPNNIKINYENLNIEVSGYEKSVQPLQE